MAIDKLLEYDSRPDATGEALVHPASGSLEKTASDVHEDVQKHLSEADSPPKDMMRLLITALSSHDTFGPNKNGDGFYRQDLLHNVDYGEHPEGEGNLAIPMYKSFEHFARPYKHHRNKDSSPAYGEIEKAFFNPKMDRVELVTLLDAAKAPQIAKKIENYEPVKTSMGFRAAYDTCSVCGNEAKSRREYCDHLKNNMLSVRPDGHIVHARNPKGKFFDISFVGTPADGTSRAVAAGRLPTTDGEGLNEKNDATGPLEDGYRPEDAGEGSNADGSGETSGNPGDDSSGDSSSDDASGEDSEDDPKEALKREAREAFAKAACAGWAGDQEVKLSADIAREAGLNGSDPLSRRGEKEAGGKKSSIDKRVDGTVDSAEDLPDEKEEKIDRLVQKIRGASPMIKEKVLNRLSGYPLETVASTMATAGISLRPEEMQHLALTKAGAKGLSRRLRKKGLYLATDPEKTADAQGLVLGPEKSDGRLLRGIAANEDLMTKRSFRIGPLMRRLKAPEKTAAAGMGANPYLRHREPITPEKARELATQEEQQEMRRRHPGEPEKTTMLEYIAQMLMGSEWNPAQVPKKQRDALRKSYRRPRRGPRRRRAQMNGRPQAGGTMTMPMANYIRSSAPQPVYGQSGIAEQSMAKESALQRDAERHVKAVSEAMGRMDKVADDQIGYVIDEPEKYDPSDVEAALLNRLDHTTE